MKQRLATVARKAKGKRVIKDNDDDNHNEGDEEKMSGKLNQKEVKEMHNFTPVLTPQGTPRFASAVRG
jgi:hypothetical protein